MPDVKPLKPVTPSYCVLLVRLTVMVLPVARVSVNFPPSSVLILLIVPCTLVVCPTGVGGMGVAVGSRGAGVAVGGCVGTAVAVAARVGDAVGRDCKAVCVAG